MKNINITREEAINTMYDLLNQGCSIPVVGLGNGSSDLFYIDSFDRFLDFDVKAYIDRLNDTEDYIFRVVPESEIAEDFKDTFELDNFNVCVEFSSAHAGNPYREQFLLWFD